MVYKILVLESVQKLLKTLNKQKRIHGKVWTLAKKNQVATKIVTLSNEYNNETESLPAAGSWVIAL